MKKCPECNGVGTLYFCDGELTKDEHWSDSCCACPECGGSGEVVEVDPLTAADARMAAEDDVAYPERDE